MASSTQNAETIRRALECSICLGRFNSPRMLPCLHTYCEKCLGDHIETSTQDDGKFPCPQCGEVISRPDTAAAGFPHHFFIDQMSDCVLPAKTDVSDCNVCKRKGSEVTVVAMCLQCSDGLCRSCADKHCDAELMADHRVVDLEPGEQGSQEDARRRECSQHIGEYLDLYCETCNSPLCITCKDDAHEDHDVKRIQDVAYESSKKMRDMLELWREAGNRAEGLSTERQIVLDNADQEEHLTGEINAIYDQYRDDMIRQIELKRRDALADLKWKAEVVKKKAELAHNDAEVNRVTILGAVKFAERGLADSEQYVDKIQKCREITSFLNSIDVGRLEMKVTATRLVLQPKKLVIPDISVRVVVVDENAEASTMLPERLQATRSKVVQADHDTSKTDEAENEREESPDACMSSEVVKTPVVKTDAVEVQVFQLTEGQQCDPDSLKQSWNRLDTDKAYFITTDANTQNVRFFRKSELRLVNQEYVTRYKNQVIASDTEGGRVLIMDGNYTIKRVITKSSLGLSTFKPTYYFMDNDEYMYLVVSSSNCAIYVVDWQRGTLLKTFRLDKSCWGVHVRGICKDDWGNIVFTRSYHGVQIIPKGKCNAKTIVSKHNVKDPKKPMITDPGQFSVLDKDGDKCVMRIFQYMDF